MVSEMEKKEVGKLARGTEQTLETMLRNVYFICQHEYRRNI